MAHQDLHTLYHCTYNLQYHLVLVTKYRKHCIDAQMLERLEEILEALCEKWEGKLVEFNGEADHVHLTRGPQTENAVDKVCEQHQDRLLSANPKRVRLRTRRALLEAGLLEPFILRRDLRWSTALCAQTIYPGAREPWLSELESRFTPTQALRAMDGALRDIKVERIDPAVSPHTEVSLIKEHAS